MTGVLTVEDLPALARGAALLGTGGGGDPYLGRLLAQRALREHGPVPLVDPADLPDDAAVFVVAQMGAPTVSVEKLPAYDEIGRAVTALAGHLGVTPTHVACIEAGGINSTIPVAGATMLGLPLVDGDGMGRAFPELQMVLPGIAGVPATPMSITDEQGNTGVLDCPTAKWAEDLARSMTITMGCTAIISNYPMTGARARETMIRGTLGLCVRIGRAIAGARAGLTDPVAAAAAEIGGRVVHTGKVVDVQRRTTTGFARGTATLSGGCVLHFQNEHLIAEVDGATVVTTPDLIMVLDTATGEPVTTEGLRFGHRVSVLAAPADPRWHTPEAIAVVGPRYFGYDTDPVRVAGNTDPVRVHDTVTDGAPV
ncbi:Conservative hypothetical protein [Pseudonocardia sp. Ae406_Ps2]|uniref:DUF917 domain-containing protein n=1 Tax=unclassified Pseudonocardia TaxID=2619320 RepID=UPI00094AF112|nr:MULTISPECIES: DUF917 domain-containing protein [unclassified Pseudonocardia]OLM00478.1 Conservative hypothetical protein [Pseudonocardia sp. Ae406_Ps2]OLM07729.1 Conservative hypothetical protein [Pseudonocardia sp. Ae331_Ps2]OLM22052.1 Conservative hypothetical protein [Pseudonocardia sp. Ae706_Ps2]